MLSWLSTRELERRIDVFPLDRNSGDKLELESSLKFDRIDILCAGMGTDEGPTSRKLGLFIRGKILKRGPLHLLN